jgi:hypothetical protein
MLAAIGMAVFGKLGISSRRELHAALAKAA